LIVPTKEAMHYRNMHFLYNNNGEILKLLETSGSHGFIMFPGIIQ